MRWSLLGHIVEGQFSVPDYDGEDIVTLSDREFEVVRLLAMGRTVCEIAYSLSLSDKTISTYRVRVLVKMKMTTNADLIRYAIKNKLVD